MYSLFDGELSRRSPQLYNIAIKKRSDENSHMQLFELPNVKRTMYNFNWYNLLFTLWTKRFSEEYTKRVSSTHKKKYKSSFTWRRQKTRPIQQQNFLEENEKNLRRFMNWYDFICHFHCDVAFMTQKKNSHLCEGLQNKLTTKMEEKFQEIFPYLVARESLCVCLCQKLWKNINFPSFGRLFLG